MGALCDPKAWTVDALGGIPACIEIKLVDFPDAGYYATNLPKPQGEIWIRGPSITDGYYQNEEETKAAFEGGWFKTGDIGEWDANGHLKIIDRKKNLVKTLNGEYIALEKVRLTYSLICEIADVGHSSNQCTALPQWLPISASTHLLRKRIRLQSSFLPSLL